MTEWAPWYVILWRLIWFIPIQFLRILLTACVAICYGENTGRILWYRTR